MPTQSPILIALTTGLILISSQVSAGSRDTLNTALQAIAATPRGSASEAQAMEQAIVAAQALSPQPVTPDRVVEYLGRAQTAARVATSPRDFLDAAEAFGDAARLAPWVGEYHFNRGLMLEKAARYDEAEQALQLYLKAAPNARDASEVRERIAGLRYLKEKAARPAATTTPLLPSGLYYNDGDFQTASTTTLIGHALITALQLANGRLTCGLFSPANPNFQRKTEFIPYHVGQFQIANPSIGFDGTQTTFCDNVRRCPTGGETGYRTGLHVSAGKDNRSL